MGNFRAADAAHGVKIAVPSVGVGLQIGFLAALALTILTSLAGMAVTAASGSQRDRTHAQARSVTCTITRVELDGPGFLTVLGGFLLLLPGFLTDMGRRAAAVADPRGRWIHATLRRAMARAERASGRPEVVDPRALTSGAAFPRERIDHKPTTRAGLTLIRAVLAASPSLC